MKTYEGTRTAAGDLAVTVGGTPLDPRLDLANHSPAGFECGYGGSGPAQLALALLAEHLGDDRKALALHQEFKWALVARLERGGWTLTSADIDKAVQAVVQALNTRFAPEEYH